MISIVVPCFNSARYLAETIESILTEDVECQLIVVDDGSTDATADVAKAFARHVHYIRTPNRGVSAARNTGTAMARGDYVVYLDSDDLLTQGTLRSRLDALQRSGADVVLTAFESFGDDLAGSAVPGRREAVLPEEREGLAIAVATSRVWAPPGALLFRRSLIDRMGGWRTDLAVVQDVAFVFDAVNAGGRFVALPEVGLRYRVQSTSLSRSSKSRFIADCSRLAAIVEDVWTGDGRISSAKQSAVAQMWAHVAMSSLLNGFPDFETALEGYNRNASRRPLFEAGRVMRKLISAQVTARVARGGLRLKGHWRGLAHARFVERSS